MRLESWPGLSALQPDRVRQFMRSRGWILRTDRSRPPVFHMYARDGELALVPGAGVGDFLQRMVELVEQLAATHKLPIWELVDDLSSPVGDVLEIRIEAASVRDGTLPLEVAATYRQAARDLVLAGAHAALDPKPHYPRMTCKEPLELLARCREGQSARGSYRIRMILPMDPQVGQLDLEPLARRTVLMVHRGASAAVAAVDRDQPDELLALSQVGVSANLLAALAHLEPPGDDGSVALAMRWSHAVPPPTQRYPPVRLTRTVFAHFRSAAQSLRASTPELAQLDGYVVQLRSADADSGGLVFVLAALGDGETRKVAVQLAGDGYRQMVDAHRDGRWVSLIGRLLQRPRSAELHDAKVLAVHADP